MLLDFREIPSAAPGSQDPDAFESFAREFFSEVMHFDIVSEPNRGADGGKDLIAIERQVGSLSATEIKWLISCKHKAHSDQSVNTTDEENISDRIREHKADGFIGFYSTLPSSGLNNRLDSYRNDYKIEIFNRERIETALIKAKKNDLIRRFFPKSYQRESAKNNEPSIIFGKYAPLFCEYCGKDLLKEHLHDYSAIVVLIENVETAECIDAYVCCKGHCNNALLATKRPSGCIDEWEDITDWIIPSIFMKKVMAVINQLQTGSVRYSQDAIEKLKQIMLRLSQFALREENEEQKLRVKRLSELPEWI